MLFGLLYAVFLVLAILFFVAWLMMPFKLNEVNRNLEEIKELLREKRKPKRP